VVREAGHDEAGHATQDSTDRWRPPVGIRGICKLSP
jgi:hypothetical protein